MSDLLPLLPGLLIGLGAGLPFAVRHARVEAAKRVAAQKFEGVFRRSPSPFFEVAMAGAKVLRQNRAGRIVFGELGGIGVDKFTVPEDLEVDFEELDKVRGGEQDWYYVLKRWRGEDGEVIGGLLTVTIYHDEARSSFAGWLWQTLRQRPAKPVCVSQVIRLPLTLPSGYHWGQALTFDAALDVLNQVRERAEAYDSGAIKCEELDDLRRA